MNLSKLRLFNLEEFNAGKKAVTRDGRIATFVHHTDTGIEYPLCALVEGMKHYSSYTDKGFLTDAWNGNQRDLVYMAPEIKTAWVNLYSSTADSSVVATGTYKSEAEALRNKVSTGRTYIGAFHVIYEE